MSFSAASPSRTGATSRGSVAAALKACAVSHGASGGAPVTGGSAVLPGGGGGGSRGSRRAAPPQPRLLRASVHEAQAAATACQREGERLEAEVGSLEQQLEDASVAVVGFQVDLDRFRRIHEHFETELVQLQKDHAHTDRCEAEVEEVNARVSAEVTAAIVLDCPSCGGRYADDERLLDSLRAMEASLEANVAEARSYALEESRLEARHAALEMELCASEWRVFRAESLAEEGGSWDRHAGDCRTNSVP